MSSARRCLPLLRGVHHGYQRDIFTSYRKKNSSMMQDLIGGVRKSKLVKDINKLPLALNKKTRSIVETMCCTCSLNDCEPQ